MVYSFIFPASCTESVETSAGRVILFGTIPTTIPDTTPTVTLATTHVDTTLILAEIPTVSPIVPPYFTSTDDPSDSDTPDTPPSPIHGTPFTEITPSTQSSLAASGALRLRVMILAPRQPIPYGRPYCGVIGERVRVMSIDTFSWVRGGGGTLGKGDIVRVNTLKLKKLINFFRSREVSMIWSFSVLGVCKSTKILVVCEYGLTSEWDYEDLTELLERESDEFVLNHEGDKNDAGVVSLMSDLTIKV
uniref:Uncharacterized protein n=1 Tax=Tanacetum cinerariifolium TaxID=118510 RepID=A0A699GTQ1_TANCI|nr:hypothetical protein [Tanacetum cinerariifolium]